MRRDSSRLSTRGSSREIFNSCPLTIDTGSHVACMPATLPHRLTFHPCVVRWVVFPVNPFKLTRHRHGYHWREVTQRQSSPVTQPVARRSSQHSRANAGHESPPVEEVPVRERPRSKSTSHQRPPMGFGEDLPPVPSHRTRAKSTHGSSSRNTSTPVVPGEYYRRWSAQYLPH
jgi:hypothetical protein